MRTVILLLLLLPSLAVAKDIYLGVKVGDSRLPDLQKQIPLNTHDIFDANGAYGVFAGYQLLDWLSLEGGYNSLAKALLNDGAAGNYKVGGIEMAAMLHYPNINEHHVFARLGQIHYEWQSNGTEFNLNDKGWGDVWGFGGAYIITADVSTRLEYQVYPDLNKQQLRLLSLSVVYRF
ncbi:outer membrane beta-barrel protein [Paraferrimonas sp. SM1919]|uniref:outer membrane beta-barrel protein n=1 Tax=Paraferrimonas sp. SM1919 TaxID=2662263 RepID=UPI0013D4B44D|nr:outer membrane beta-barrel protein [Paraferrimonas sp. SM1919]